MASIAFEHVGKRFDQTLVLKDLNFRIADEEFVVLVGPSGCGKSTALRLIAGLEEVSEGRLSIGERLVNDVAPKDRDVAMVFQSYALYPHMTVRENISFGLRLRKFPREEIERMVNEAATLLGLKELLERKPKALSGGQRQRVALGRAIVRKPAVFLFDEPLSNLDAELRVQMRAEISKLQRRLKTTTVYVTHDQVEAMTMGHRIAVLAPVAPGMQTNLRQIGTPLELYDRPQNVFVAHFIGTPNMNMLRGSLNGDGSGVQSAGLLVPVPEEFRAAAAARRGQAVVLGVRPEHIGDPREHDWAHAVPVRGTAEIVETIGHEVIVHLRSGEERLIAKLRAARRIPHYGEAMELALDADAVHLFDAQTEQRLG